MAVSAGTNTRCRSGTSSPTGAPLRVTTKDSPLSKARMISPLWLRSSRCVISRLAIAAVVAHVLRNGRDRDEVGAAFVGRALEQVLYHPSSRSRPTNGGSSPEDLGVPRTPATSRTARHRSTRPAFALSSKLPASSYTMVASGARLVDSPRLLQPGWPGSDRDSFAESRRVVADARSTASMLGEYVGIARGLPQVSGFVLLVEGLGDEQGFDPTVRYEPHQGHEDVEGDGGPSIHEGQRDRR